MRLIGLTRCCASVAIWLGGQIVDAAAIEGRRPRLNAEEKAIARAGGTPAGWFKAHARQIDRDGRWTIKRDHKQTPPRHANNPSIRRSLSSRVSASRGIALARVTVLCSAA
jgi:hypothetical protein